MIATVVVALSLNISSALSDMLPDKYIKTAKPILAVDVVDVTDNAALGYSKRECFSDPQGYITVFKRNDGGLGFGYLEVSWLDESAEENNISPAELELLNAWAEKLDTSLDGRKIYYLNHRGVVYLWLNQDQFSIGGLWAIERGKSQKLLDSSPVFLQRHDGGFVFSTPENEFGSKYNSIYAIGTDAMNQRADGYIKKMHHSGSQIVSIYADDEHVFYLSYGEVRLVTSPSEGKIIWTWPEVRKYSVNNFVIIDNVLYVATGSIVFAIKNEGPSRVQVRKLTYRGNDCLTN